MYLFFILIFFNYVACAINFATGDINKVLDNSPIIISLQHYNASTPDGESIDTLYTIPAFSLTKIVLTKIPDDVHFVVLQAHSYLANVTLSLDSVPFQSNSIQGTNVGLVKMYQKMDLSFFLTYNSSLENVDVMVSVQAYSAKAPIPGGCNMEFQVEISPFLLTSYNEFTTDVNFAPSAPPRSVLPPALMFPNNECNLKPSPVHHRMYHRYFPERDFSKETYFSMLKSMMTKGRIQENGNFVPEKLTGSPMKRIFATYPGTGSAFVVISHFENSSAVYVPSYSYGCNDLSDDNTCVVLTTTFSKVLCASVFFLGIFNCFFGHYFCRIEMFLFLFLAYGIVFYIFISLLFNSSIALIGSVSGAFFISAVMVLAWTFCGLPLISITLVTSVSGFLLASIIYYPIIDFVNLMVLDINFWGIFIGIVLSCPILMLCLAEKANIISSAFIGSYIAILSVDHYIGSNLRYIIINTIRRAVADKFNLAIIRPPFQWKDFLLCFFWITLMFLGIAVQKLLTRNKPPYPPPVNPLESLFQRWRRPSPPSNLPTESGPNIPYLCESTPLLGSVPNSAPPAYTAPNYYDGN